MSEIDLLTFAIGFFTGVILDKIFASFGDSED